MKRFTQTLFVKRTNGSGVNRTKDWPRKFKGQVGGRRAGAGWNVPVESNKRGLLRRPRCNDGVPTVEIAHYKSQSVQN